MLLEELAGVVGVVVEGGAHEHGVALGAVGGVERGQLGMLLEARHAPAGEEVEHHPAAALVRDVEAAAVDRVARPSAARSGRSAGSASPARCSSRWWRARRPAARPAPRSRPTRPARCAAGRARRDGRLVAAARRSWRAHRDRLGEVLERDGRRHRVGRAAAGAGPARRPAPCRGPSRRRPPRATGPSVG